MCPEARSSLQGQSPSTGITGVKVDFHSCWKDLKEGKWELLKSLVHGTIIINQRQCPPKFKHSWKSPSVRGIPGTRPGAWVSLCEMQTLLPTLNPQAKGWKQGRKMASEQKHGARDHMATTVRKEKAMDVATQLHLSCSTFIHSGSSVHGVVLHTFRIGLPSSLKPLYKHLDRHAQQCVSWVMLNFITLTIKMNTPKYVTKTTRHFQLYNKSKSDIWKVKWFPSWWWDLITFGFPGHFRAMHASVWERQQ